MLFSEKLFKEILPVHLNAINAGDDDKKAVETFKRFSTYFKGFHENRRNIYSPEAISTGIPFRIVHDNFPKFLTNLELYTLLKTNHSEVLTNVTDQLQNILNAEGVTLDEVFTLDYFNKTLTQTGIDVYNLIIGGQSDEPGKKKIQGINEVINLYCQQHPALKIPKMLLLFKQILSDRDSRSFVPKMFDDDQAVQKSISDFYTQGLLCYAYDGKNVNVLKSLSALVKQMGNYDSAKIQIDAGMLSDISNSLFESWGTVKAMLAQYAIQQYKAKATQEKYLKSQEFTLADLNAALKCGEKTECLEQYWTTNAEEHLQRITDLYPAAENVLSKTYTAENKLREQANDIETIKTFLDAIMEFMQWLKPLHVRLEANRDLAFYSEFDPLFNQLTQIVPLYNKVRNYVTQKPFSKEKVRLFFENRGQFLGGWVDSQTENSDNGTQAGGYLFRKKNETHGYDYYLGVSADSHMFRRTIEVTDNDRSEYERLDYYQLKTASLYEHSYVGESYTDDKESLIKILDQFVSEYDSSILREKVDTDKKAKTPRSTTPSGYLRLIKETSCVFWFTVNWTDALFC